MKIITCNIQKGGCGKSTTSQAVVSELAARNYRCLLIDLDPQSNSSFVNDLEGAELTIYEVLKGICKVEDAIYSTHGYDMIPSNIILSGADGEFIKKGKEYLLKKALEEIQGEYDYVIIDTPPSLGVLSINALTASDFVIIPIEASIYAFQGLSQLNETINTVKKYSNSKLKVLGLLLVKFSVRAKINKQVKSLLIDAANEMNTKVFNSFIRESVVVKESQAMHTPLIEYAPGSNPCKDYNNFVNELEGEINK